MARAVRLWAMILLLLALAACGGQETPAATAPIPVGIVNTEAGESGYRAANVADFERVFTEDNGYDAAFFYGADSASQQDAARALLEEGVRYLLLSPASPEGWEDVLEAAQAAGVPVILFDRTVEADQGLYAAAILPDPAAEGAAAADWLENQNLEDYRIVHLQGTLGSQAQLGRTAALEAKIESEGWQLVAQQCANWRSDEAEAAVQAVIDAGTAFHIVYAENDNMARGAQAALERAGIPCGGEDGVVIVSFDCAKFALQNVVDGLWRYDGQSSPFQADLADALIRDLEQGVSPKEKILSPEPRGFAAGEIEQEDVAQYGI